MTRNANVRSLLENRIENEKPPYEFLSYELASAKTLCKRLDIGLSSLMNLIKLHRIERIRINSSVRYRVVDVIRVIDPRWSTDERR